jgi:hypothetical protein
MANIYGSEAERRMSLQSYMLMKKKIPSKNIVQAIKDTLRGKKKKSSKMMVQGPHGWVGVPSDELMGTKGYDYFDYAEYPQFDYHQFGESNPTEYWPGNQEAQETMIDLDEQAAAQVIQDYDFTDASADAGQRAADANADMMDARDNQQRAQEAPIYDQEIKQIDAGQPKVSAASNYPGRIPPMDMPISFPSNITPEIPGRVQVAKTTAQAVQDLFKTLKGRKMVKTGRVNQNSIPDYELEDRRTLGKHHHGGRGGGGWGYGPYYPYDYWMYAQPEVVYVEQVDDVTKQSGDIGKGGGGGGRRMSRLDPYYYPYDPYYYPPPDAVYVEEQGARWQEEFGDGYTDYRPTDPLSNEPAQVADPMQDSQWYKIDDAAEWVEQEHGRRAAYQEWIVNELAKRGMTIDDLFKKPEDRAGSKPESNEDDQWWKPVGV